MSIKSRVKSLEKKNGAGFMFVVPVVLDKDGNRFVRDLENEAVAAARLIGAEGCQIIYRHPEESFEDFNLRVVSEGNRLVENGMVARLDAKFV